MPSVGRGQRVVMVLAAVLSAGAAAPAAMARPVGIARAQSAWPKSCRSMNTPTSCPPRTGI